LEGGKISSTVIDVAAVTPLPCKRDTLV